MHTPQYFQRNALQNLQAILSRMFGFKLCSLKDFFNFFQVFIAFLYFLMYNASKTSLSVVSEYVEHSQIYSSHSIIPNPADCHLFKGTVYRFAWYLWGYWWYALCLSLALAARLCLRICTALELCLYLEAYSIYIRV